MQINLPLKSFLKLKLNKRLNMFKLKYFVILIMVGCLVGMVSAETATSGDTDGSSAWSSSVAYDIDAGTYSVSTATVEDAAAAPAVTTTASEVGGEATTASVDATNADSATMTSAASDGLASSSSEFVATGVDGDKITVAGADQTTGITAAGTSYARQDGTVTSTGTAVVAAASDATAADGATAGTGVVAATEDGTIVLNSQYARGVAEARAGQRVSAFGDDISISAGTYADDGASTSAGVFTSADLSGTASLTIAQRAVADPDAGGESIARQRLTNGHGTGTVIAGAYSEGASSFSGALAVVNADDGNSMVINHINQRVETDATNSYATNDGLIWEAGTGDIEVLAGTIEGTDNGITGNFVAADGFLVDFDQHSQTTTDVDTIGAHSQQNTAFVDAAGIIGSIAVNDEGSIAGTIAGTNDGSVHTNQVARLTATGVAASQIGNVNTPDGTGIMATAGMSGEGPNAYAYTIAE